jgi:hypothetical protein
MKSRRRPSNSGVKEASRGTSEESSLKNPGMRKGTWFSGFFGSILILRDVRCLGFSKDLPPERNVDGLGLVFFSAFAEKVKNSENIS